MSSGRQGRGRDPPSDPPGGSFSEDMDMAAAEEADEVYFEPKKHLPPFDFVTTNNSYEANPTPSVLTMDNMTLSDNPTSNGYNNSNTNNTRDNNKSPVELTTASAPGRVNTRYAPVTTPAPPQSPSVLAIPSAPTGGAVWDQSMIDLKREAMNDYGYSHNYAGPPVVTAVASVEPMIEPTSTTSSSSGSHNTPTQHNYTAVQPRYSEPSMLSIREDLPIQFPHHDHRDAPLAPTPTSATANRYTRTAAPNKKFQNEVSVDSWGMAQQMHNEISVDGFMMAHEEQWRLERLAQPPPKREVVTNEVNVDSVLDMHARPVEAWRTRATSESKGLSVLQLDAPLGSEINVDSVLRIERERPPPPPPKSVASLRMVEENDEYAPQPPKPFGPPSMLDEEINVDSVIRINAEARRAQQAKVAALHQQQEAQQQQAALQQWQQKVAKQQQEHSISITPQQREELNQISPDLSNNNSPSKNKSPKKKKEGLFSKMFRGKGGRANK